MNTARGWGMVKAVVFLFWVAGGTVVFAQNESVGSGRVFFPGEGVRISVFPETDHFLAGDYPVDSDGTITLPMLGRVEVSSLSSAELRSFLQIHFEHHLRFPDLQLSPLMRISMLGGFEEPGLYYVMPQSSLWDLVYMAGGTLHESGLRRMRWERSRRVVGRDLVGFLESGVSLQQAGFRSGDQIWTPSEPRSGFWSGVVRDVVIRDILPLATFMLTLYVSLSTINN